MKILLVNPPRSAWNGILEHAPGTARPFIHRKLIGPPLGLLTVAAAVRDHDVTLLDMKGEYDLDPSAPPPGRLVRRVLEEVRPDIAGVTVITSELKASMEILSEVRDFDPGILTVAGGLHATLLPRDFEGDAVDVVCPGQSALVFRDVVRAREAGEGLDGIGGLYVRRGSRLSPAEGAAAGVDAAGGDFIMPRRELLRRWLPTYRVGSGAGPATYLFTSLGCPHRCVFCSIWPLFGGRFMQRSVESVVAELKTLDDYPVVRFADANTVVDLDFARELFRRIGEEGIRKDFVMDLRVDTAAAEPGLLEIMAKGGLKVAICGFESFRDEELSGYKKASSAAAITAAVRNLHASGIMVRGNYVVPPHYDEDDFKALGEFAASHAVSYAGYTILTPMPGTAFFESVKDRVVDRDYDRYNFFNCVMRTKMPLEKFYENVARLWSIRMGTDVI
jgi:radical SAM superfamily enzyme YgiQ (UPF0313 family)